jgi:hypothetical protein
MWMMAALAALWGGVSAAQGAATAPAAPAAPAAASSEAALRGARPMPADFEVLRQKTIFSREHVKPPERTYSRAPVEAAPPRPPVLIGVIKEDETEAGGEPRLRAVIETPSSGSLSEYHIGDVVPGEFGGTIRSITLDGAELSSADGGAVRQVKIGQNLQGGAAALGAPSSRARPASGSAGQTAGPAAGSGSAGAAASAATAEAPADGAAASESGMSVVERLRARRQQELAK